MLKWWCLPFFLSVPVSEIWEAASWTFVQHHALNLVNRSVAKFGRAGSILPKQLKPIIFTILKGYCLPDIHYGIHTGTYPEKKELGNCNTVTVIVGGCSFEISVVPFLLCRVLIYQGLQIVRDLREGCGCPTLFASYWSKATYWIQWLYV